MLCVYVNGRWSNVNKWCILFIALTQPSFVCIQSIFPYIILRFILYLTSMMRKIIFLLSLVYACVPLMSVHIWLSHSPLITLIRFHVHWISKRLEVCEWVCVFLCGNGTDRTSNSRKMLSYEQVIFHRNSIWYERCVVLAHWLDELSYSIAIALWGCTDSCNT